MTSGSIPGRICVKTEATKGTSWTIFKPETSRYRVKFFRQSFLTWHGYGVSSLKIAFRYGSTGCVVASDSRDPQIESRSSIQITQMCIIT